MNDTKRENGSDFPGMFRKRIAGARRIAVIGVGDELSPVDRLGMVAAKEIGKMHLPCVKVFLAGTVPESITGLIRKYKPDHVVVIDSADMGALPGSVQVVKPEETRATLVASHVIPLSVVMDFIRGDMGADVTLLGIQPDLHRLNRTMAPRDQARFVGSLTMIRVTLEEV